MTASDSSAGPTMYAAPPAPAVYSSASPGLPWAVSMPSAIAYLPMPEPTRPMAATSASVPALQANSQSAACVLGTAPMASATMVDVGFTAYGCDSEPTHTARSSCGSIPARAMALRAASIDIVATSSSRPGTAFSLMGSPPLPPIQTRATSRGGQPVPRNVCAIANDADRLGWSQQAGLRFRCGI